MENIVKAQKAVERHLKSAQKFIDKIEKEGFGKFDLEVLTKKEVSVKLDELFDSLTTEQKYLFLDLENKLEDIERANKKLVDQQRIAGKKEAKEETQNDKMNIIQNLPKVIVDFLEEQKQAVIGYFERRGLTNEQATKIGNDNDELIVNLMVSEVAGIVGTITDAKNLHIANDGSINGIIIGTNGKAEIHTFMAGGHTVQKAHYRTRVTKL